MVSRRTVRALALAALGALPALGQFESVVTTEDGSIVLFSSPLRLKNTDEPLWPKLFIADARGTVRLFDASGRLIRVDMSADGATLAVTKAPDTVGGSASGEIRTPAGGVITVPGTVRLSENGLHGAAITATAVKVVDLARSGQADVNVASSSHVAAAGARIVSDDGRILTITGEQPRRMALIRPDLRVRLLTTKATPAAVAINADMSVIAYETEPDEGPHAIRLLQGPDGEDAELVSASEGVRQPVLTSDGGTLLFLSAANWEARNSTGQAQAWMIRAGGSGLHQLTTDPAGIAEAAISGDGAIVWAVSNAGRLLRVDIASGEVQEITGRTPLVEPFTAVRGSLVFVRGRGLTDARGGAVELTLGGKAMPLVYSSPSEIRFQMPWDAQGGDLAIGSGDTPFDSTQPYMPSVIPRDTAPQFVAAAHGDFHGVVTAADPAAPGEIVNLYMTGLGPVSPAVAVGKPAPANPPSVITTTFAWKTVDHSDIELPADVLYAGLAPGMFGVYQVSVRLPAAVDPPLCIQVANESDCLPVRPPR